MQIRQLRFGQHGRKRNDALVSEVIICQVQSAPRVSCGAVSLAKQVRNVPARFKWLSCVRGSAVAIAKALSAPSLFPSVHGRPIAHDRCPVTVRQQYALLPLAALTAQNDVLLKIKCVSWISCSTATSANAPSFPRRLTEPGGAKRARAALTRQQRALAQAASHSEQPVNLPAKSRWTNCVRGSTAASARACSASSPVPVTRCPSVVLLAL